jgi:RNA polymerase sigma factor (sigma-70 family)
MTFMHAWITICANGWLTPRRLTARGLQMPKPCVRRQPARELLPVHMTARAFPANPKNLRILERTGLDPSNETHRMLIDPHDSELREFISTRQTLLSRLKHWADQDSWREFYDIYWRLIYRTARHRGLSDAEADDVVQETFISVAKAMPDLKYDPALGSFKRWLLQLTSWRIANQVRKRLPAEALDDHAADDTCHTNIVEQIPDPEGSKLDSAWNEEWERNLFDAALERVKHRVDPKQYQIFDFYVLQKWPVKKVARVLGLNAGQVYLAKLRTLAAIKKELKQIRKNHIP